MNLFLLDLWADLREKRLWPVAALLLIGLVSVPLVVAKPARDPQPKGPDPAQQAELLPDAGVKVLAAEDAAGRGSALDLFDPKDPFRPPQSLIESTRQQSANAAPAGGGGGGGATSEGSGGSAPESGGGGDSGGGDSGGGGGAAPEAPAPGTPPVKTEQFAYVVDVTFRANNRTRRIKALRRLEFLPNESKPLLLFLGVSADLNNAVFLVDSTLEPYGEGRCKPNADKCSLLYLGAGELHYFNADDGNTYALQVDQIRRVKISGRASSSRSRAPKGSSSSGQQSSAGESSPPEAQPEAQRTFVPPVLADIVSVASP